MEKYILGEISSSGGATLYKNPFNQTVHHISIIFTGGKHSLPSGLPTQYYHGYIGCIKKVKMFRRKLDLLRHGDNSNLKLCDT